MKARLFSYVITLIIVGLALWAAVSLYLRYIEHPWTRDGQVRANIVGIPPRVSGPIIHVAVHDNQQLRKGDLLFKETQLPDIQVGQKAIVTVMGDENQPFQGVVRSVGWGVFVQDGSGGTSTALLPSVSQTIDWVRLPQRFPVRIQVLENSPVPLRIGQTVSVAIAPEFETPETNKQPTLAQP